MNIVYTKKFQKRFKLLNPKLQNQFFERMDIFLKNPNDPQIRNHPLKGYLRGYRSFSVTGDVLIFKYLSKKEIKLIDIGTHNQVY